MIFFKVIVVSIIRKKCVIVFVSIIYFSSIVPSSGYICRYIIINYISVDKYNKGEGDKMEN